MRLVNNTDLDDDSIRNFIRAVRPSGISNFDVHIGYGVGRGVAYTNGHHAHDRKCPFIKVFISKNFKPYQTTSRGAYISRWLYSQTEQLIDLLSHELRHLWQAKHSKGKVWGSKGQFSERDADAYSLNMLRKFRRGELV